MIKVVYSPPPADRERIEDVEPAGELCLWEEEAPGLPPKMRPGKARG